MIAIIREIKQYELSFLEEMLYEAIFIPERTKKLPKDIIKHPELLRYIKNFGQSSDLCFMAEIHGHLIGAIWTRVFNENEKGCGFVNNETPELSMAVFDQYRQKGIGTMLLKKIIEKLLKLNYSQISLSVDKHNYAYGFYKKHGFVDYSSTEKSVTMTKRL